jgi:acyl carrier protein
VSAGSGAPTIAARVCAIVADHLGVEPSYVTPDATLAGDLGADSLDRVELEMAIEEDFGFEVPNGDAEKLLTVADVVAYVERHILERG